MKTEIVINGRDIKYRSIDKTLLWATFFIACAFYLWQKMPVELALDAQSMYNFSLKKQYTDFFPPLSMLLWHYLSLIYPGGETMLIVNMGFLWGACAIGIITFTKSSNIKTSKLSYLFILIPFIPSVFLDAGRILKDTIFSFGYMFICMILTKKTIEDKNLNFYEAIALLLGVIYFSMAKVQTIYVIPIVVCWIVYLLPSYTDMKPAYEKITMWVFGTTFVILSMGAISNAMIKKENDLHYWQYLKIYDLAGMSVMSDKMYVPKFLFKHENTTVDDIGKKYEYLWEPLIRYDDSPLRKTSTEQERELLKSQWLYSVADNPIAYLQHRFRVWFKIISASPAKGYFIESFPNNSTILYIAPILSIFSFVPLLPIMIWFLYLGLKRYREHRESLPILMLASMGLIFIAVMFFCTLAAAGRYIFFSYCCFGFALPIALSKMIKIRYNHHRNS